MLVSERVFDHPSQGSTVRLAVYETPANASTVDGMPDGAGFLVIEEWRGSSKVVKTLGFFPERSAAQESFERRAEELARQRYRPVAPAA